KFDGKADEGFLVGYSVSSKAFRVFNSRTRNVQETLHIIFLENTPNVAGSGPTWLFDIDTLSNSMNYQPVTAGNQPNPSASIQGHFDAEKAGEDNVQQYVLFPLWSSGSKDPQNTNDDTTFEVKKPEFEGKKSESEVHVSPSSSAKSKKHDDKTKREAKGKSHVKYTPVSAVGKISIHSTNTFSAADPSNIAVRPTHRESLYVDPSQYPDDPNMPALEDITYFDDEEDVGAEADFSNLETTITISPIPTTRVHKDHLMTQIIGDLSLATQTRSMTRMAKDQAEILRKFGLIDGKSASTPIDTEKPLLKDPDDSDYAGESLDRKSTTWGCQFLGCRLISWQYKKQTVVAASSTEAEYVAAASCCAQLLWI
nr:ribonuclease H-like domain-containing protein [Tanacetum cinerariifolium]